VVECLLDSMVHHQLVLEILDVSNILPLAQAVGKLALVFLETSL
jgi:hypothetical protein